MKIGDILYKTEKHSREKGVEAYKEHHVVGETSRSWLINRHLNFGIDRAAKVPKNANPKEYGYLSTMEEVEKRVWADDNQYKIGIKIKELCYNANYEELKEVEAFIQRITEGRKK